MMVRRARNGVDIYSTGGHRSCRRVLQIGRSYNRGCRRALRLGLPVAKHWVTCKRPKKNVSIILIEERRTLGYPAFTGSPRDIPASPVHASYCSEEMSTILKALSVVWRKKNSTPRVLWYIGCRSSCYSVVTWHACCVFLEVRIRGRSERDHQRGLEVGVLNDGGCGDEKRKGWVAV